MSAAYELAQFIVEFMSAFRSGDLAWKQQKLDEIMELKRRRAVYDANLNHELEMLSIKFAADIEREKEKHSRTNMDYKEFLDSLDEMKKKMLDTFTDMPTPMVFIIHHHAKQLIDEMWQEGGNARAKEIGRAKFQQLLMAVYEDTTNAMVSQQKLPEKTLKMLNS